jgi:DNA-directed RNA polymerase subunit M/transcription elongation factor TFIIS
VAFPIVIFKQDEDAVTIDDPKLEKPLSPTKPKPHTCSRCGAETGLPVFLPKFADQPAYNLFRCAVCGFTDWVKLQQ